MSVIEECGCNTDQMLGASVFCPHQLARYQDKIRREYLTTLAGKLDERALNKAKLALKALIRENGTASTTSSIEAAYVTVQTYLNQLINEEKE